MCGKLICRDCSVEYQPGIRVCRECYNKCGDLRKCFEGRKGEVEAFLFKSKEFFLKIIRAKDCSSISH